jgi:phenylpyruvate tautomerase PptA (4-oxalocrotonate tautomerase family)
MGVTITYPVTSTIYGTNWTGTITGTASSNSGASLASTVVAVKDTNTGLWWNGTSFAASSQTFVSTGGTPAAWNLAMAAGNLTSGHNYTVTAQATDGAGNLTTTSATTFTYNSSTPTVAVTYPVNGTTYGANWTGTITGTASSNSGSSLSSTVVAVENTTTSKWWNGTSFNDATQTFVAAPVTRPGCSPCPRTTSPPATPTRSSSRQQKPREGRARR